MTRLTAGRNSPACEVLRTCLGNFYAYSPYGEVATLGPDGGNSLQFTGRENDGIGTYLYRARTFDPILKRFTSEDPIGIDGGINLYAYVHGNPLRYTDPLGLDTYLGGIGVTLIAGFGIEGGLGLLLNPGSDDECFDIGIYGSIAV